MVARNHRQSCGGRLQSDANGINEAQHNCPPSPISTSGGHIRVAVRVRPIPQQEVGIIEVANSNTVLIQKYASSGGNGFLSSQKGHIETRSFDRVFGPEATQREVYETTCAPLLTEAVIASRCATIFAYGATGAGKTHTMFGNENAEKQGIILRAIPDVFKAVAEYNAKASNLGPTLQVKASFLEIYNETVRDLLQEGGGLCKVLEDERRGIVAVSNLHEPAVQGPEDALGCLQVGMQSRTVESTAANSQSSRAHAVFSLTVERVWNRSQDDMRSRLNRGAQEQRQLHTKISFIDLAGSERAAFTQNVGQALKDGARINQSLLALANCIDALIAQSRLATTGATPRKKAPYRDSKLTLMLKGSLMGDGRVAMIANVHPGRLHFEDSNNTLEYAKRASTVKATNRRLSRQSFGYVDEFVSTPAPITNNDTASRTTCKDVCDADQDTTEAITRRQSSEPDLSRAVRPSDNDVPTQQSDGQDEETSAAPTRASSTSSLPVPARLSTRRGVRSVTVPPSSLRMPRRTRRGQPLPQFTGKGRAISSCEITTASSQEECLSEISLSSGQDGGEDAGNNPSPPSPVALSETIVEGDVGRSPDPCWEPAEMTPELVGPEEGNGLQVDSHIDDSTIHEQRLTMELVAKLQQDNESLESRLRSVMKERNALLKDREALEEENERLRQDNIEKDQQLIRLLSRAAAA